MLRARRAMTPASSPSLLPTVVLVGPSTNFLSGIAYYTYGLARALADDCRLGVLLIRKLMPARWYPGGIRVGKRLTTIALPDEVERFDGLDYYWGPSAVGAFRFLSRHRPDVVVLQWWTATVLHSFLAIAFIARLRGARIIIEFHETLDSAERTRRFVWVYVRLLAPRLFSMASAYVAHSAFDQELLCSRYGFDHTKIVCIPHPVYEHQLRGPVAVRQPGEVCHLLFFGLIRPIKGLDDLIVAFDRLSDEEVTAFELTIVGETWEHCGPIVDMARRSRHSRRITIVNRYVSDDEADKFFRGADVVVLPYRSGSQSGVLHTAMGYGLPVVVTKVGGLVEAASGYPGAELAEPNDPDSLLEAIRRARKLTPGAFSYEHRWRDTSRRYRSLFDDVLTSRWIDGA